MPAMPEDVPTTPGVTPQPAPPATVAPAEPPGPPGGDGPPGDGGPAGRIAWQASPLGSATAKIIVPDGAPAAIEPGTGDGPMPARPKTQIMLDSGGGFAGFGVPGDGRTTPAEDGADTASPFDHAPPFEPKRNRARGWIVAGVVFLLAVALLAAAAVRFGVPDWVPLPRPVFGAAQTDLRLSFPPERQDRRTLPNGSEYFGASGTITNTGRTAHPVPPLLVVLRDDARKIVYRWEIQPPRRDLEPGETMTINEAVTDAPRTARTAQIGWKPQ